MTLLSTPNHKQKKYFNLETFSFLVLLCVIVFAYYWFLSTGKLTSLPPDRAYFDKLATAFLKFDLHLEEKPPIGLLALKDPYDKRLREDITYLWDASLYNGNYYLYWGPVPAVLLAIVKAAFHPGVVGDQVLLFTFALGLILCQSALMLSIHYTWFPTTPRWTILLFILLAALNPASMWAIGRPAVYVTSIVSGQFFLMAGLIGVFFAFQRSSHSCLLLVLTGITWGASLGCRYNLAPAIAWLTLAAILFIFKQSAWHIHSLPIKQTIAILAPLVLSGFLLALYNYFRFGNFIETGIRYQLTGAYWSPDYGLSVAFSPSYVIANLYNYLLRPIQFSPQFPFISFTQITRDQWLSIIHLPKYYVFFQENAGLLYLMPMVCLSILPGVASFRRILSPKSKKLQTQSLGIQPAFTAWWHWSIIGACTLSFTTVMLYYFSTVRFMLDFVPLLLLLITAGFWQGYQGLAQRRILHLAFIILVCLLIIISLFLGILTGFDSEGGRFLKNNPILMQNLAEFFSRQ
jgi:hypothetical protein